MIDELLPPTPQPPAVSRGRATHDGFQYEWDGNDGFIQTGPLEDRPTTWDEFILDAKLDPEEVEVVEPVQVRGWDAPIGDGNVQRMHYYRITVRRRMFKVHLDQLVTMARKKRPKPPAAAETDRAYVIALGDLQLGKMDGDGVEGTIRRFVDTTAMAVDRYKHLKRKYGPMPIVLSHLGDCIEGYVSQGGALAKRVTLTTTDQVELYGTLLTDQVVHLAGLTPDLTVIGIPGNHDEAFRPLHTYDDSWAIYAIRELRRALELAGRYEHVKVYAPARDELTVTLDIHGTVVGMAHGHQWRAGQAETWWAKQAHGRQPIGDADVLLSAHLHHLRIEHTGAKTWIQVPALESESTWWRHRTGSPGRPGIVTMLVGGGTWHGIEVLTA